MNYLLDIAKLVLPALRTCRLRQDPGARVLRVIDRVCPRVLAARRICRKRHYEHDQHRVPQVALAPNGGSRAPEPADVQPDLLSPADMWAKTCDAEAADVIADVLSRFPDRIPRVLSAIGCAEYYPSYLEYLLETVIEVAQPSARIDSKGLFAWIKARFIPAEYAALLRDRHPIVAEVLCDADCGRRLIEISRAQSPPAAPKTSGLATAHMFGAGGLAAARDFGGRVAAQRREATPAEATSPNNDWQVVAKTLAASPESIGDCLRSAQPNHRQAFVRALRAELLVKPALVLKLAEVTGAAAPFGLVFAAELDEIQASRARRVKVLTDPPTRYPPARASDMKLFGLALSGGGIRSATFNLGILQGLAQLGMLREIDYLSTVSGGGYIGAWLAAWIKRASIEHARGGPKTGVCAVEELLRAEPQPAPDARPVHPLRFLREYSNYLTPQTGFFSADTWTMVTVWVRNTLLNQLVLVLALAAALLVPWNVWFWLTVDLPDRSSGLLPGCWRQMGFSALLLWTGAWIAGSQLRRFNLPPVDREKRCADMLGQGGVVLRIVTPAVIACAVLARVIFEARAELGANAAFRQRAFLELFGLFIVCHGIVSIRGEYWKCFLAERVSGAKRRWTNRMLAAQAGFIITLAGVIGAGAGAGLAVLAGIVLGSFGDAPLPLSQHWVVLGVPTMTVVMSLMIVLKLGVLGRNLYDEHREWWSRVGAWLIIVSLAWLVIFGFAIYSPFLTALAASEGRKWITASGGVAWALWTVAGVQLGKEDKHAPGVRAALTSSSARKWIVLLAPYVFIAGLLVLVSTAAYSLVAWNLPSAANTDAFATAHWSGRGRVRDWLPTSVPLLGLLAYLLSWRVDINEFSMHHFYKNRLVRCYLGASRGSGEGPTRSPDPFTGFDRSDEVPFADLRMEPGGADPELRRVLANEEGRAGEYVGPLPIVNVALNLVKGDDLAWQERKAQSFAFTPLYCGYEHRKEELHDDRAGDDRRSDDHRTPAGRRCADQGFRATPLYGYPPFGVGLGTATAISGAAASPSMGYHSSPATAFLMTVFNARLGWWMGNPRDKFNWLRSGPHRGLLYLVNELFGLTNDHSKFVNLSDGGHFENLGLYELVRRRCRYVIACDAEQDDNLAFGGLGNAIRKCRIDLGAEITIRATRIHPAEGSAYSPFHSVVGEIRYSDGEMGTLVYLKASMSGDEPADVLEYKSRQPAFPHHSTVTDQFFDESQFESYRKLGFHVAQTALGVPTAEHDDSLEWRFECLRDYWYPPSAAIERHFSDHASQFDELLERVRKGPGLEFIDEAFFDGVDGAADRQQIFIGVALLDLMQRVFIDLHLEHDSDHPHNAGWMTIFSKWKKQAAVDQAWNLSHDNYGRRFQWFFNHRL